MDKNFDELKQELRDYKEKIEKEGEFEKSFNKLINNQELKSICDRMQKKFPKQPSIQDINAMIYTYTNLEEASITEKDRKDWQKQLCNFAQKCPEGYQNQEWILYTMESLKKAKASPKITYAVGKAIMGKLPIDSLYRGKCSELQFENVDKYYEFTVNNLEKRENFASYEQQTKAFKRASNILLEIKPTVRWDRYNRFSVKMRNHYNQSEWGRLNFGHDNGLISNKIFDSLPSATKQAIKASRSRSEFYAR